jgi:hypothetical protein
MHQSPITKEFSPCGKHWCQAVIFGLFALSEAVIPFGKYFQGFYSFFINFVVQQLLFK